MNKTKKYKKKVKKYKLKKFSKRNFREKKFTKRKFSRKKSNKRKHIKKRFTKKKLTQKGGADSFTDAVNTAEDIGGGVDLFNLAGSVSKTIFEKFGKKVAAEKVGEGTVDGAAAGSGEAETENVSQAATCKGLTKMAKLASQGSTYAGIAAGIGLGGTLGYMLMDKQGQSGAAGKYNTQTTDTNQSRGTANDAANSGPEEAKKENQQKEAAGVTS